MIQLAHDGHQGQDKTLQWMRQSVWFPNMEAKVRELVRGVLFTMPGSTGQDRDKAPEADRGSREGLWQELYADYMGPTGKDWYLNVLIDIDIDIELMVLQVYFSIKSERNRS